GSPAGAAIAEPNRRKDPADDPEPRTAHWSAGHRPQGLPPAFFEGHMTRRYRALSLLREGLRGHRGWQPAWRKARPRRAYDAVIVGGGGHGLATAYYLARNHGLRR